MCEYYVKDLLKLKNAFASDWGEGYLYETQLNRVTEIIETISKYGNNEKESKQANVIGVSGERGSGKTSFLMTLKDYYLKNNNLIVMDIIDPGLITSSLSLLEIIITLMDDSLQNDKDISNNDIICFKSKLKKILHTICDINTNKDDFYIDVPALDVLGKIQGIAKLPDQCKELINEYSNLKSALNKKILIMIDDLDMVKNEIVVNIIEGVKTYLPSNVIAVIAYREIQLKHVFLQGKILENKVLIENKQITLDEIQNQGNRYLEKLISADNKIVLFNKNTFYSKPIYSYLRDFKHLSEKLGISNDVKETFDEFAAKYVYEKCFIRIQPISEREKTVDYLPDNLRGMIQFFAVLANMKENKEKKLCTLKDNLLILNDYYFMRAQAILDFNHNSIVQSWDNQPQERKHYYLYHEILNNMKDDKKDIQRLNVLIKDNSDKFEPYNLTIANVYSVLEIYKETIDSEIVNNFVYIMKVIYSIYILNLVIDCQSGSETNYNKYQTFIGGKIIPDSFGYNYRRKGEDLYIIKKTNKNKDENKLINKMLYSEFSMGSDLRTSSSGELLSNRYIKYYNIETTLDDIDANSKKIPIDPFSAVLKKDFLDKKSYIFYSMMDIDVIVRSRFGRDKFSGVLKLINDLVTGKEDKFEISKYFCNAFYTNEHREELFDTEEIAMIDNSIKIGKDNNIVEIEVCKKTKLIKIIDKLLKEESLSEENREFLKRIKSIKGSISKENKETISKIVEDLNILIMEDDIK
ncbi:MAG: P-loop NTPase fold protein [Erysipelotrichaceae bacterium]